MKNPSLNGEFNYYFGPQAAPLVPAVWPDIPERVLPYILWNTAPDDKERVWYQTLAEAELVCFVMREGKLYACAWIENYDKGDKTYPFAHFFFCGKASLPVALKFWDDIARLKIYQKAFVVVPLKFRWARYFIYRCGFKTISIMKDILPMYGYKTLQDGELMSKDL